MGITTSYFNYVLMSMQLRRFEMELLKNLGLDYKKYYFNPWFNGMNITIYMNYLKSGSIYCPFVHHINDSRYYVELKPW